MKQRLSLARVLLHDPKILLYNGWVHGLSLENIRWMFTSFYMTTYQPLGRLLYAVVFELPWL